MFGRGKKQPEQTSVDVEAVSSSVGVLHVMPKAYQGGMQPASLTAQAIAPPSEHRMASPPVPPKPALPEQKKVPTAPVRPEDIKHQNQKRVRLIVIGLAAFVLVAVLVTVALVLRSKPVPAPVVPPPVETAPVTLPPPPSEPEPVSEPTPVIEPFAGTPTPGRDSDSDGLTDVEEAFYNSNARLPDTDGDGFLDGNEVFHEYDPTVPAPATLRDAGKVATYTDTAGSFQFLYPVGWQILPTDNGEDVRAPSGEIVSVLREEISEVDQTFRAWVLAQSSSTDRLWTFIRTKTGLEAAVSADQMSAFVVLPSRVVVGLTYDTGEQRTIEYLQTMQMLENSIRSWSGEVTTL